MRNLFSLLKTGLLVLSISYPLQSLAHAGIDHGDNCFLPIAGVQFRLGGVQSEAKLDSSKHYCHLFPNTGKVIFTFEPEAIKRQNKQLTLKLLAANSNWDILFNYNNAFQKILNQTQNKSTITHYFSSPGLYILEASLQTDKPEIGQLEPSQNNTQRFLFLVGFPVIKILVLVAFSFLLILVFVALKQLKVSMARKN